MQNVYQKYQPNMQGISTAGVPQNSMQPQQSMQGVTSDKLREQTQDSYVANRVGQMSEINPIQQGLISIPVWYGLAQLMDKFAKKCRGNYEDTIQYKMTNAGDVITDTFQNSSIGKSEAVKTASSKLSDWKSAFRTKIIDKSAVLRALFDTPSKPELGIVKAQANGMYGIQLGDYQTVTEHFFKQVKYAEDLDCYGADKTFIDKVKADLKGVSKKADKKKIIQEAEFELLGKNSGLSLSNFKALNEQGRKMVMDDLKAQAQGYRNFAHWNAVKENIQGRIADVIEATHKADKNMYSKIWTHDNNTFGKVQGHLFGRKVYASEFQNKLLAELGTVPPGSELESMLQRTGLDKNLPKSGLGRFFGKYGNMITEGATNRVAGGKLAALIQAWFLAEAIIRTSQAEKGDKISTFMERLTELVAFFAAMPLALKLMHHIGGMQYAGMTAEQIASYRKDLAVFNQKVKDGLLKDKELYKAERRALESRLKAGKHNIFARLAKRVGRVVTVGLEQIRPYTKHAVESGWKGRIKDIFRNPKYWFKQGAGYPVRIAAGMLMILPFISKFFVKGSHLIFGKPKNSVLDEGKEDKKAEEKAPTPAEQLAQINQLEQAIQQVRASGQKLTPEQEAQIQQLEMMIKQAKAELEPQIQNQQPQAQQQTPQQPNSAEVPMNDPQNMLSKYKNLQPQNADPTHINKPGEPIRTYIPSPEPVKILEPERSYVPSPMPASINNSIDTSAADSAMQRADIAERMAMQTLAMK
ncbi:hypothetical protein J6E39_08540 [bacterium]|nr:hypothetical protein [bacterium]